MKDKISVSKKELILVSLESVLQKKEKCTIADLIHTCFTLFPKQFALKEYPQYPDSMKLDRDLRELKAKGLIVGNPRTYFKFTKSGQNYVDSLKKINVNNISTSKKEITRSPVFKMLEKIKSTPDFSKFIMQKRDFLPNDMNFRGTLGYTLETSVKKILEELNYLLGYIKKSEDRELKKYLKTYISFYKRG